MTSISRARERRISRWSVDLGDQLVQFLGDLLAFEAGQALQAQIEDRARLRVGQLIAAVLAERAAALADQRDQRRRCRRPASAAPISPARAAAGSGAARISAMISSILATATSEADQDMRALARLVEQEGRCGG